MKSTKEKKTTKEEIPEDQNIDKIRDILFGVQVRDFERRFSKLEERFNEEIAEAREETNKKLNELEEFINREVSSLMERISVEQHSRQDDVKKLSGEINDASHEFDKKMTSMGEQTGKNESELRQKILEQSKSLTDEMKKRQTEILTKLERESNELREDKADRTAMAEIFTEMAMRLTGDFKIPKAD
jgi:hypothetical protein